MSDVRLIRGDEATDILTAEVWFQRAGNWSLIAEEIGSSVPISGEVVIDWQGTTLRGYVLRSQVVEGVCSAVILGGRGGLAQALPPKMYDLQILASMPLGDILREAGEALAPSSDPAARGRSLSSWVRRAGDAGEQLSALGDAVGAVWRVLADGSVWFGADAFPPAADFDHDVPEGGWHPTFGCLEIVPSALGIMPGQRYSREVAGVTIAGNVAAVCYCTSGDGPSGRIYFQDERAAQADGAAEPLRAFVRETMRGVELLGTFSGQLILQRADGTVDVIPDDKRLPGLTSVRVPVIVPGARLTFFGRARCRFVFEGGDIRYPAVTLYDGGANVAPVARVDDTVEVTLYFTTTVLPTDGVTVVTSVSPTPPGIPIKLVGKITSGSPHLALPRG